jgi:hypothetical protein
MKSAKKDRLQRAGWRVGTPQEFLGLTEEEAALIEIKLALAQDLRKRRLAQRLTQGALAKRLGSSQSRVAKMEASDPTVTVDLLIRGLLAVGASRKEIAWAIGTASPRRTRRATTRGNIR